MLKQPVGFVKLTNIALIKFKTNGRKFEIACYKNKVLNWRNGAESNLTEVIQTEEIYANAAQGEVVKKSVLEESFPNKTKKEIILLILEKGEMQVSQKEREAMLATLTNDIVNIISTKIVHPKTKRVFSVENIRASIKDSNIGFNLNKSAKKQAMDAIKILVEKYYIEKVGLLAKAVFEEVADFDKASEELKIEVRTKKDKECIFLISHKKFNEFESKVAVEWKDKLVLTVLDNNYIEKEIVSIEKTNDAVMLPRADPLTDKKLKKKKVPRPPCCGKPVEKDEEEIEVGKKEVIGNMNLATLTNLMDQKESEVKVCHTCQNIEFPVVAEYKHHIKSELHKFNLQRKIKNETALNFEEFQNFLLMTDFVSKKKSKK